MNDDDSKEVDKKLEAFMYFVTNMPRTDLYRYWYIYLLSSTQNEKRAKNGLITVQVGSGRFGSVRVGSVRVGTDLATRSKRITRM